MGDGFAIRGAGQLAQLFSSWHLYSLVGCHVTLSVRSLLCAFAVSGHGKQASLHQLASDKLQDDW